MAVLDAADLLTQARWLLKPRQPGLPLQVDVRRAVSGAYYAVFHHVLTAAADHFVGSTRRADRRYPMVYRSIDHKMLKDTCNAIKGSGSSGSVALRNFAKNTIELQDKRHTADYDPTNLIRTTEARTLIDLAQAAIALFDMISAEERSLFLTQLTFKKRH